MKKTCILLVALLLLSGCANPFTGPSARENGASGAAPESWGARELPSQPQVLSSQKDDSAVDATSEGASPGAPPEALPASFQELAEAEIPVWLSGTRLSGILYAGTTLISVTELSQAWPWLQVQHDGTTLQLTGQDSAAHTLSCQAPETFTGEGGVFFTGLESEYWLPIRWLSNQFGMNLFWDGAQNAAYLRSPVDKTAIPQGTAVPVLMYHAVAAEPWGIEELFVTPENMRAQLQYLKDNGYDPIFFSDLSHLSDYDKPILLTFDDGYDDNYTQLFPLLREFGVKATIFVITGELGNPCYMTAQQIREMADSGLVEIQSHTVSHQNLSEMDAAAQERELSQSQLELTRITGRIPYVLSYPSGKRNEDTLALAANYYDFGVDMNGGTWMIQEDYYKIDRIYIARADSLDTFHSKLLWS